jgi:GT2 family glycosyltransferase
MKQAKGPLLSIIIVNYNAPAAIAKCIQSIDTHLALDKEVIVVDNDSTEEHLDDLSRQYAFLRVLRLPHNSGFGCANNTGVKNARGEMILLLNSDTELVDTSLQDAVARFSSAEKKEMWGFRLLWPDGRVQDSFSREISYLDFILGYTPLAHFGKFIPRIRDHKYAGRDITTPLKVAVVYAAAILLWRRDFLDLNGFDRRYFLYYEDIDLCDRFRIVLGGEVIYDPGVSIIHHVQGSSVGNPKIRLEVLKSKFRYGLSRFGWLRTLVFVGIDLTLAALVRLVPGVRGRTPP